MSEQPRLSEHHRPSSHRRRVRPRRWRAIVAAVATTAMMVAAVPAAQAADPAPIAIPRALLSATASSEAAAPENAASAIDGDTSTHWHIKWAAPADALPQSLTVSWPGPLTVSSYTYAPRTKSPTASGIVTQYQIAVSTDGTTYTTVASGTWDGTAGKTQTATFAPVTATSVRFTALASVAYSGVQWAAASEVSVITTDPDKANAMVTLKSAIASATATAQSAPVGTEPGQWTQASVDTLVGAAATAQTALTTATTATAVTTATTDLATAVATFQAAVLTHDRASLEQLVTDAIVLRDATSDDDSHKAALVAAITAAQAVLDDEDATSAQVGAAYDTLTAKIAAVNAGAVSAFDRQTLNFNTDWRYVQGDPANAQTVGFDASAWTWVNLPHSTKFNTPEDISDNFGVSWYRKTFDTDPAAAGKRVYINFEAAMPQAKVWVNGVLVGSHVGGYTPFMVDVTDVLNASGANVIAVRIDNTPSADFAPGKTGVDFRYFGGIYRDVTMTVTSPVHVPDAVYANEVAGGGVFVTTPTVAAASSTVQVQTSVQNDDTASRAVTVHTELTGPDGAVVAQADSAAVEVAAGAYQEVTQTLTVTDAKLWDTENPNLYTAHVTVHADGADVDQVTERFGIRHVEWTTAGLFLNGKRIKAIGTNKNEEIYGLGNAVPDSEIYEDVKRVKDAGFDFIRGAHFPHSPAFYDAADELGVLVMDSMTGWQTFFDTTTFKNNTYQELRDMIRRDRNHPSVVVWETSLNESQFTAAWASTVQSIAHAEYPGDQMYTAGWKDYFDVYIATPSAGIRTSTKTKPQMVSEWGDWEYGGNSSTSRAPRESYDSTSASPNALTEVANHQNGLNANLGLGWFTADALWDFADMSGYNSTASLMGVTDYYRIPKFDYYFFASQRDPGTLVQGEAYGPMVYIANTWSADSPTSVTVFSNADQVRLYKNGTLVATRSPDTGTDTANLPHPPFTFDVGSYAAGELRAEALIDGQVVATTTRKTAQTASKIDLVPDTATPLQADGSDARLVRIDVVDANGTVAYKNTSQVQVSVTGPGEIVGPTTLTVKGGQLAVWVRAKRTAGEITLTAKGAGLTSGTATLTSVAVPGLPAPQYDEDAVTKVNVAAGKTATASSSATGAAASLATDGDAATSWTAGDPSTGSWLQVDLGARYDLTGSSLTFPQLAGYQYRVETSDDGIVWDTAFTHSDTASVGESDDSWVGTGRYVRVLFTGGLGGSAPSVAELALYGDLAAAPTPVDVVQEKTRVTASTSAAGHPATSGNDGNPAVYWQSATGGKTWWSVDLGARYDLTSSIVTWLDGSRAYQYTIEVSNDGVSYRTVADRSTNATAEQESSDAFTATARFVRISVTGGGTAADPVGFYSFKALGVPTADVALRKSATATSSASGSSAALANDTATGTSWVSADGGSPSWTADLGASFAVTGVDLDLAPGSATGYLLEGSADGTTWTTLVDRRTSGGLLTTDAVSGTVRHLRVTFPDLAAGQHAAITDLSAYTTADAVTDVVLKTAFPSVTATATYTNQSTNTTDKIAYINDGTISYATSGSTKNVWTNWVATPRAQDTITFGLGQSRQVSSAKVYVYTDSGAVPPTSIVTEYLDPADSQWKAVTSVSASPAVPGQGTNTISFAPVTTTSIRFTMTAGTLSTGVVSCIALTEIEVYGQVGVVPVRAQSVAVAPASAGSATIPAAGGTLALAAAISPSEVADAGVTWSATNADPSDADPVVSVDAQGVVTGLRTGVARVTATTTDGWGTNGSVEVTVGNPGADETAPGLTVDLPAANAAGWYTSAPVLTAGATDADSGVASIEYRLGASDTWVTYSGPLTLTDATTVVEVRATDVAGNVSDVVSRTVKIDTAAPVAALALPDANLSGWFTTTPALTASATDAGSGVQSVEYRLGSSGAWTTYTTPVALSDDVMLVEARATDQAGNVSDLVSRTVRTDTVAPVVTGAVDASRVLAVTATDLHLASVQYSLDGLAWADYTVPVQLGAGEQTVGLRATDEAGNVSVASSVHVDALPPSATATALAFNGAGTTGSGLELSAAVVPVTAAGAVEFLDGGQTIGSAPVVAGTATWTVASLAEGAHSYQARFVPADAGRFAPSTSTLVPLTSQKNAATVTVRAAAHAYGKAGSATVTVRAAGSAALGSVQVAVAGTVRTLTLVDGAVTVPLPATEGTGTQHVYALYAGNATTSAAVGSGAYAVARAATRATLTLSARKATVKKTRLRAAVRVTVPGTSVVAAGTVTVRVGKKTVSTVTLTAAKRGVVKVTLPRLTKKGTVKVTVTYSGGANLAASTSKVVKVKVVKAKKR